MVSTRKRPRDRTSGHKKTLPGDQRSTGTILYGIELKSFTDQPGFRDSLEQTALYGQKLGLTEIYLVAFVENIDETSQKKFQTPYMHPENKVTVYPLFIQSGKI